MASYRVQADLMAYMGAQYINAKARPRLEGETDEQYAQVPVVSGVFIPDKYNDILVQTDNSKEGFRNASGLTARISLNVYPLQLGNDQNGQPRPDQKLVDAAKLRVQQSGEEVTAYNIPAVSVNASFRKEFIDDLRKKVAAKLLRQHPEWAGTSEEDNPDLRRAVSAQIPYRLGLGFLREPKNAAPQQAAAPAPIGISDFGIPVVGAPMMPPPQGGEAVPDDLPF